MQPYAEAVRELPAGRLLEIDGQRISVEQAGEGDPLVLLHGFGESTLSYAAVLPELAKRFAVVAIDLNGFGYTERPRDRASYTLAGQERLVLGVLDRLGLDRVRLAGHSYGGGLALYLAARHPERIDRLLLIDNTLPLYASLRRNPLFAWRWVARMAAHTFALSDRVIEAGLRKAYFDDSKVTPESGATAMPTGCGSRASRTPSTGSSAPPPSRPSGSTWRRSRRRRSSSGAPKTG